MIQEILDMHSVDCEAIYELINSGKLAYNASIGQKTTVNEYIIMELSDDGLCAYLWRYDPGKCAYGYFKGLPISAWDSIDNIEDCLSAQYWLWI